MNLSDFKVHGLCTISCCLHYSLYHRLTYNESFTCKYTLTGYESLEGRGPILLRFESSCPGTVSKTQYIQHSSNARKKNMKKLIQCSLSSYNLLSCNLLTIKNKYLASSHNTKQDQSCPSIISNEKTGQNIQKNYCYTLDKTQQRTVIPKQREGTR